MRSSFLVLACVTLVAGFISCSKNDNPIPPLAPETVGAYILNNGKWQSNNASLSYYNLQTREVATKVFATKNAKKLGDLGQDMVIYGGKMYITVANSGVIFVTDKQTKIIKEIQLPNYKTPRSVVAYQGKVYATYFEGALAQIDTTTFEVKTIPVGNNPDELGIANGNIYVANSDGMNWPPVGNTVSVVDIATFTISKEITVAVNPRLVEVDNQGDVYLISSGDYSENMPAVLQRIDTKTNTVQGVELSVTDNKGDKVVLTPNYMAMGANDKLYIVCGKSDMNGYVQGKVYCYNTLTEKMEGEFVTDGSVVQNFHYISADKISGNVYIGSSDYINNGDMYVFTPDGKLEDKFDTGGLNPMGVYFLTSN